MTHQTFGLTAKRCRVEKYRGEVDPLMPERPPYEVVNCYGNVLVKRGAYALWQRIVDGGGTTNGWDGFLGESDATPWAGAYIAVGNVGTAATSADTDLGAAGTANAFYMTMVNAYPQFTEAVALNTALGSITDPTSVDFRASFTTSVANFAWREWALGAIGTNPNEDGGDGTAVNFTDTGGTFNNLMINHKIYEFGTKTSADTWIVNATFVIA